MTDHQTTSQRTPAENAGDAHELRTHLRFATEHAGSAFHACAIARKLSEENALTLSDETVSLLDRERYSGHTLHAFEACRALRADLDTKED